MCIVRSARMAFGYSYQQMRFPSDIFSADKKSGDWIGNFRKVTK